MAIGRSNISKQLKPKLGNKNIKLKKLLSKKRRRRS
mgnify:CR=1 FL=1|tara:strand:- start:345 stop:452 length:108 start_codon:yes stop_codon:yes gene_type:complete